MVVPKFTENCLMSLVLHPKFSSCDCPKSDWPLFFKLKNGHVRGNRNTHPNNPVQAVQSHILHKIHFQVLVELELDPSNFVANIRLKTSIFVRRQCNGRGIVSNVRRRRGSRFFSVQDMNENRMNMSLVWSRVGGNFLNFLPNLTNIIFGERFSNGFRAVHWFIFDANITNKKDERYDLSSTNHNNSWMTVTLISFPKCVPNLHLRQVRPVFDNVHRIEKFREHSYGVIGW